MDKESVRLLVDLVVAVLVIGAIVWALRAKPIGGLPYRWGTWIALMQMVIALGIWVGAANTLAYVWWVQTGTVSIPIMAARDFIVVLRFVALVAPYVVTSIGLLQRRRYGAVLACVPILHWATLLLFAPAGVPLKSIGVPEIIVIFAGMAINWAYFRKRWPYMVKPKL